MRVRIKPYYIKSQRIDALTISCLPVFQLFKPSFQSVPIEKFTRPYNTVILQTDINIILRFVSHINLIYISIQLITPIRNHLIFIY